MGDISILISIQPILVGIDIVSYRLPSTKDIDMAGHAYLLQLYNLISNEIYNCVIDNNKN